MIRKLTVAGVTCLALSAGGAYASGLDLSGQPIMPLFGEGTRAGLSFASINPRVSGTDVMGQPTGDIGPTFTNAALSYKTDLTDKLSVAVLYDQPFFRHTEYSTGFFAGTKGLVEAGAVTLAARYRLDNRWSVHGGLRIQQFQAEASTPLANYSLKTSKETDLGYIIGVAYEIPEYHVLVALTYNSEITHSFDATENGFPTGTFDFSTPEAVNLDFRAPVSRSTLVFGNIRYAKYDGVQVSPPVFTANSGRPLLNFKKDTVRYSFGVIQKFNDTWSGLVRFSYAPKSNSQQDIFGPTNGSRGIGLGAIYSGDRFNVAVGVDYVKPGSTTGAVGTFDGGSVVAMGIQVSYKF